MVFVHASNQDIVAAHGVDFAARHFRPEPRFEPRGTDSLLAATTGLWNLSQPVLKRVGPDRTRPLLLLGMDYARRVLDADARASLAWRRLGQLETLREPSAVPIARFRMRFDPVFDLSPARATYALEKAIELDPEDFTATFFLVNAYNSRDMNEEQVRLLERLPSLSPANGFQTAIQVESTANRARVLAAMGPKSPLTWENRSQLAGLVNRLLAAGRARTAADVLEDAVPADARTWEEADRLATLRLHLGEPDRARASWQAAAKPPHPAIREARVAATYLVEGSFDLARQAYRSALDEDPNLFEARYGLAVLEQDAGRAPEALTEARKAVAQAPNDVARSAAQGIVALVTPYATSAIDGPARDVR
jgi:tetratricopeptide (TPR) repeat protein